MDYKKIEQKLAIAMMENSYIFKKAARKIGLKKFVPLVSFLREISQANRLQFLDALGSAGLKEEIIGDIKDYFIVYYPLQKNLVSAPIKPTSKKSFYDAQIAAIKKKHKLVEKVVEENSLGGQIQKRKEKKEDHIPKEIIEHGKLISKNKKTNDKEKIKNNICYYLIGSKYISRGGYEPRDWLEEIWKIYTDSRIKEYKSDLYKKTWDLDLADEVSQKAFDSDKNINELIGTNFLQKNSDLVVEKIAAALEGNKNHLAKESEISPKNNVNDLEDSRKKEIFQHDFIFNYGIYHTPQALVERSILLRAAMILNGINPYGKRDKSSSEGERYAYSNPIKATIFGLHLISAKFRTTLFPIAQGYWGTHSEEFKFFNDCVLRGIDELIDKLENFTRLKNLKSTNEGEFKEKINLKILADLRDVTPIRMSLELGRNNEKRKLLGLKRIEVVKKELRNKGKKNETYKTFKFSDVKKYLENNPRTSKILAPEDLKFLHNEERDLTINDIYNY